MASDESEAHPSDADSPLPASPSAAASTPAQESETHSDHAPPSGMERYGLPGSFTHGTLEADVVEDIYDTNEIFTRIAANADREFGRSTRLLFWSGLAAGLTISLSFLGMATVEGMVTGPSSRLISALFYPLGFMFIVLGRYQLFTENTFTPVTLVLTWRASLPRLLRIWGVVLLANLLGTAVAGLYFSQTDVISGDTAVAASEIGRHMLEMPWWTLFSKGTIAGWLVSGMVWLNHAARTATARVFIIFALMYTVAAADLAHCIVGSSEMFYLVFEGELGLLAYLWDFLVPAALGNTVGGVFLVALLNYAQTEDEVHADREALSLHEWLWGSKRSEPTT